MKKFFALAVLFSIVLVSCPSHACEVLAASFSKAVQAGPLLKKFWSYGSDNPHGWGFTTYLNGFTYIFKAPDNAARSQFADNLTDKIKCNTFIAHVREASVGNAIYLNAHPFARILNGKEYVMVHNGTLKNEFRKGLKTRYFFPAGKTDSEQAFCYVMDQIKIQKLEALNNNELKALYKVFKEVNSFGRFNCILEVGDKLIVYQDIHQHNNLKILKLGYDSKFIGNFAKDAGFKLPEYCSGYLLSARPLSSAENWTLLKPGQMLVLEKGKIIYKQLL
ncbi:class II glutamine amidotransferase [Lentisphaerota bacterium ZTH]|nr:class II glutamine amidotransferase [Lentisphaerota bacterium]WET07704.1 class II glutamine amidotransferase [Lentisphaerota bacterium ZTH]